MQTKITRALYCSLVLVLATVFVCTNVWADFYVVAVGKKAKKTVLVSPESTQAASGTSLRNAINAITDATASNPYLVIIEPGIYDIGSTGLTMKPYVDIQGSGEDVTKITGNVDSASSGVIICASNSELRFLTVENTGGANTIAIYNVLTDNSSLLHLTAIASGGTVSTCGVLNAFCTTTMVHVTSNASGGTYSQAVKNSYAGITMTSVAATASGGTTRTYGVYNDNSPLGNLIPTMTDVIAVASGGTIASGVYNDNSDPTMMLVTAKASSGASNYGVWNVNGSHVKIDHSVIISASPSATVFSDGTSTALIGNSRLDGGLAGLPGRNTCAGVYDESYTFYASTCP